MNALKQRLNEALQKRKAGNAHRTLTVPDGLIDFSSNDYLGLARSQKLRRLIEEELEKFPDYKNGSTGSRLLTGNSIYAENLERKIAAFHKAEAGLIFNSGYDANLGLFSCVPQKGDTIIYDALVHASIRDGIRLSLAASYSFRHNDISDLEQKLKRAGGRRFIAVESVYSMDGDMATLHEIIELAEQHNAAVILDEAHATGIFGQHGEGLAVELGLVKSIFARIHTFGKALGVHGAVVAGSALLKDYLVNFSRSFIYTTALPFHSLAAINCAYDLLKTADRERENLKKLIALYNAGVSNLDVGALNSKIPIQGVVVPGNDRVKKVAALLREKGFDVRPILSPTVAAGSERLRICLHTFNTEAEVRNLIRAMMSLLPG